MLGVLLGTDVGCLSGDRGRVSARGPGRSSVRGTMKCIRPGADVECPLGGRWSISSRRQMQDVRPGADVIDLREIHLARQSSLQVPVGHIPVPGGIKLCSPGTFWVANYLIINNGSCQVNFTKPNSATIRNTNSQWLREDGSEVLVGRVAVPKTGQKSTLPREDATEASVGRVAVPKTGQKSTLPREDATEAPVDRVPVPKTGQKPPSPRGDAPEVPVGRVAVPKTGQKSALPREDATEAPVGRVAVPKTGQKNALPREDGSEVPVGRGAVSKHSRRSI